MSFFRKVDANIKSKFTSLIKQRFCKKCGTLFIEEKPDEPECPECKRRKAEVN